MAVSNAAMEAQIQALTQRVNNMAPIVAALSGLQGNAAFLASLSRLPSQTTSNSDAGGHDNNTGSSWASGERGYVNNAIDAVNGLVNAVNILQQNLKNHGFES